MATTGTWFASHDEIPSWEDRIRYLLRAALRAEGEGEGRVAYALRAMAADALPVDPPRSAVERLLRRLRSGS